MATWPKATNGTPTPPDLSSETVGATPNYYKADSNPTTIKPNDLNTVMMEINTAVTDSGQAVDPTKSNQLSTAIQSTSNKFTGLMAENGWSKNEITGKIEQWGTASSEGTIFFPIPFTNQCFNVVVCSTTDTSVKFWMTLRVTSVNKESFICVNDHPFSESFYWQAIGY